MRTTAEVAIELGVTTGYVRQLAAQRGLGKRSALGWLFTADDISQLRVRDRAGRPSAPQIRVTIEDLESGETETVEVGDDYLLICAGKCYEDGIQVYPTKGTHVITVKGVKSA